MLKKLVQSYVEELLDFQPIWATALGEMRSAHRYADLSEARIHSHLRAIQTLSRELRRLTPAQSWGPERLEYELFKSDLILKEREWGTWKKYRQDPSLYIGELTYGLWYLFLRESSPKRVLAAALGRLRDGRRVYEAARANLRRPPRLWTQIAIEEAQGYLGFLQDVRGQLLKIAPRRRAEIMLACREAEQVGKDFLKFFRGELLRRSNGDFAVGKARFNFLLKNYHHYSSTADQLLKLGKEQFQAVKRALVEHAKVLDPKTPWHRLVEKAKRRHPSAPRLLATYREETRRLRRYIRKNRLVSLPRGERLSVIETPAFTRNTIPFAAYVDPPMFRGKNYGTFFVTPVTVSNRRRREELLGEHNYGALRVTALHEGYPGHHLQFAVQRHAPSVMMKLYNCSSFFEGWALYCEEMMYESGYYDAWGRLIQLKDKLWRACRVIVDVSLHTRRMSDREAVRFMAKELKMSPLSARADVNWYTMRPTVPQSYLTGMLKIRALREKCRKRSGKKFSFQKFHDALLRYGAIPIPLVEKSFSPLFGK